MRQRQFPTCFLFTLTLLTSTSLLADESMHAGHHHSRVDAHAPINVMGDHLMRKGTSMISYRLMTMHMEGLRSGTDNISSEQVSLTQNPLAGEPMRMGYLPDGNPRVMNVPATYRIAPQKMDMRMHMLSFMRGISNNVTAMLMLNYIEKEMTSLTYKGATGSAENGRFTGTTSGLGDTRISALYRLKNRGKHHFHLNLGVSLPTGSITKSGRVLPPFAGSLTPAGQTVEIERLAYNMQLGSGTVDFLPGITYTAAKENISWGAQLSSTLRFYDNKEHYRLGNRVEGTAWLARRWAPWVSTSARISAKAEGSIKGRDSIITGGNPLSTAANSGRDEVNWLLGINLLKQTGRLKGQRLALEVGAPLYEKTDGIQMSNDWTATLGWQMAF